MHMSLSIHNYLIHMETTVLCRIRLESVLQKYATALFTDLGTRMKWALRLEELLRVSVSEGDSSYFPRVPKES